MEVIHPHVNYSINTKHNMSPLLNPQREFDLYSSLQKFLVILYFLFIILFIKCRSYCCTLYYLVICLKDLSIFVHTDLLHLFKGCPGLQSVLRLICLPGPEQKQILSLLDPKAELFPPAPRCLENQCPLAKFHR